MSKHKNRDESGIKNTGFPISIGKRVKRPRAGNGIYIVISILIFMFSLAYVCIYNCIGRAQQHFVENGVLDLRDWDGLGKRNIRLTGEWEFYPGELKEPSDMPNSAKGSFDIHDGDEDIGYIKVPGDWSPYLNHRGTPDGAGTYRLVIRVPEDGIYGIKTETIRTAGRVFLNGDEIITMGKPAITRTDFVPSSRYAMGFSKSKEGIVELIIQVSSFGYPSGGILKDIRFGSIETIVNHVNRERAIEAFTIAMSLITGIMFLFVFFQRGYETYQGYFSMGNIFMALYLSTMNNQLLSLILNYDLILRLRIQIFTMTAVALCSLRFMHHFLRDFSNKRVVRVLSIIGLSVFIFVINDPRRAISFRVLTGQIYVSLTMIIIYAYSSWILLKAIKDGTGFLKYIILITSSLTVYWFSMMSKILFEFHIGNLPQYMILVTVLGIVLLINARLHAEFKEVSQLTEERLEKEFKYFYSQISPHFLFNTINTIIALSFVDTEKTRKALNNLSVYFRGKLELHMEKGLIPLEEELDMVIAYLEMEKLRYGDELLFEVDIEGDLAAVIPPLTLQPLVENAVNHGIKPKEGPGTIKLTVKYAGREQIEISIEDDGVGMTPEKRAQLIRGDLKRLGFKNIIRKIKILKGFSIDVQSALNIGTTIRITLPGVKGHENFDIGTVSLKALSEPRLFGASGLYDRHKGS